MHVLPVLGNTIGSFSKGSFSIVANIAIIEKDPSEKDPIAILAIIAIVAIVAWSICGPQDPKWRHGPDPGPGRRHFGPWGSKINI